MNYEYNNKKCIDFIVKRCYVHFPISQCFFPIFKKYTDNLEKLLSKSIVNDNTKYLGPIFTTYDVDVGANG